MYHCTECISFDFCFRCMMDRDTIHPKDHEFIVCPSLECPATSQNLAITMLITGLPIRRPFAIGQRPKTRVRRSRRKTPLSKQRRGLRKNLLISRRKTLLSKETTPMCQRSPQVERPLRQKMRMRSSLPRRPMDYRTVLNSQSQLTKPTFNKNMGGFAELQSAKELTSVARDHPPKIIPIADLPSDLTPTNPSGPFPTD